MQMKYYMIRQQIKEKKAANKKKKAENIKIQQQRDILKNTFEQLKQQVMDLEL